MTDDAVCQWDHLRATVIDDHSPINFWMGDLINRAQWPEREVPVVCPVIVPDPECQK